MPSLAQKGGTPSRSHTTSMPANYDQQPGMFASSAARVMGHGFPYNYYTQSSAAGRLSPTHDTTLQAGGTKCLNTVPTDYHVMGPNNGGNFDYVKCSSPVRTLGMGAGKQAGGKRRNTRRRSKKGTKSKTHSGKNFETRKSSKKYEEKKWKKFFRGRKTLMAPDFPFAGGANKRGREDLDSQGTADYRRIKFGCFTNKDAVKSWLKNPNFQCGDSASKKARTQGGGYRYSQKRRQEQRNKSKRVYHGGYHVPGSNVPNTPSYSTGRTLPGNMSALANPVPYQRLDNCIQNSFSIRH